MLTDDQRVATLRVIQSLYDVKSTKNRSIAEPFAELPDRVAWKDYYRVIPHPRCLNGVQSSVENGQYDTPRAAFDDLSLVFANALHFNENGSPIAADARTLKTALESAWASETVLQPEPESLRVTSAPPVAKDEEMSASEDAEAGGGRGGDTNWESMKPRDKAGDDIIRRTEASLLRWKGPTLPGGWMTVHEHDSGDPYVRYSEILNRLKSLKDAGAETLACDALIKIPETVSLPELSFMTPMSLSLIESRVSLRAYPGPKEFDMDMYRLFEKGRRWFQEGSKDYGRVLLLQRLHQGLTSSVAALRLANKTANHNFASIPAGPGFAKPLNSAASTSEDAVTTYRIQSKDRTFIDEAIFKGMSYRSGDYVHIMNPNDASKPIVGQVFKAYIPDGGQPDERFVTVCWYFRPEQTFHPPTRSFWEHEVFKTGHFADHAIEDVIEKVACQFMTRHIRGRPKPPMWYPNWPLYVCDSRYNDRDRVIVRIKNWNSCIPDELRKADFMPILPFERTVMPRKVDSPFVSGMSGPGGLVEEEEWRRKSKRAAAKSTLPPAFAPPPLLGMEDNQLGPSTPAQVTATSTDVKNSTDRSLIVAAGGRASLGADPVVEILPEETLAHFDRHPRTKDLLWFSGPPIQPVNPRVYRPQYSVEYLAFLARKKAAAEKERAAFEEEGDDEDDEDATEEDHFRRRKKAKQASDVFAVEEAKVKPVAPPTLLDIYHTNLDVNPSL